MTRLISSCASGPLSPAIALRVPGTNARSNAFLNPLAQTRGARAPNGLSPGAAPVVRDPQDLAAPIHERILVLRPARPQESGGHVEHPVGAEDEAVDVVEDLRADDHDHPRRRPSTVHLLEADHERLSRQPVALARHLRHGVDEPVRRVLGVEGDSRQPTVVEALPADPVDAVHVGPRLRIHRSVRSNHPDPPAPELRVEDAAVRSCSEPRGEGRARDLHRRESRELLARWIGGERQDPLGSPRDGCLRC